jgi:Flp pilus assembly protein TadG
MFVPLSNAKWGKQGMAPVSMSSGRDTGRRRAKGRGQSLVEFAIILPVFLLIAYGVIDFGLAFDASIGISNAAREGAREGATLPNTTAINDRVREVAGRLNNSNLSVNVTCKTASGGACPGGVSGAAAGYSIIVRVSYSYPMMTPLAFGTAIPLSSTSEMRVE